MDRRHLVKHIIQIGVFERRLEPVRTVSDTGGERGSHDEVDVRPIDSLRVETDGGHWVEIDGHL
jgi:hypothetical protein